MGLGAARNGVLGYVTTCSECGGEVRIIVSIEDPAVIQKILAHLDDNITSVATTLLPDCRA